MFGYTAAEAVGYQVAMEEYLATGVKPDLLISGPRAVMSAEVQRSRIGVPCQRAAVERDVGARRTYGCGTCLEYERSRKP